jgi:hypothetical protein
MSLEANKKLKSFQKSIETSLQGYNGSQLWVKSYVEYLKNIKQFGLTYTHRKFLIVFMLANDQVLARCVNQLLKKNETIPSFGITFWECLNLIVENEISECSPLSVNAVTVGVHFRHLTNKRKFFVIMAVILTFPLLVGIILLIFSQRWRSYLCIGNKETFPLGENISTKIKYEIKDMEKFYRDSFNNIINMGKFEIIDSADKEIKGSNVHSEALLKVINDTSAMIEQNLCMQACNCSDGMEKYVREIKKKFHEIPASNLTRQQKKIFFAGAFLRLFKTIESRVKKVGDGKFINHLSHSIGDLEKVFLPIFFIAAQKLGKISEFEEKCLDTLCRAFLSAIDDGFDYEIADVFRKEDILHKENYSEVMDLFSECRKLLEHILGS